MRDYTAESHRLFAQLASWEQKRFPIALSVATFGSQPRQLNKFSCNTASNCYAVVSALALGT